MKNLFKKLTFAVAMVTTFSLCIPAFGAANVYAACNEFTAKSNNITVEKFKSTAKVGDTYTISEGKVGNDGSNVTETVTDPDGIAVAVTGGTFRVEKQGNYVITYTYELGAVKYSTDLKVNVSGISETYSIAIPANTEKVVPTTINPEKVNGELRTIEFPAAVVTDENGDVVEGATVATTLATSESVTGAGWNASTKVLTIGEEDDVTYEVTYTYTSAAGETYSTKLAVYTDTDYENDYKYTYGYNSTKPTTAEVGVETKLPGVTATTENGDTIPVHYSISVKVGTETFTTETANSPLSYEDGVYKLTPKVSKNHEITYTVADFFGNTCTTSPNSFTLTNIKDKTAPTPVVVAPYAETALAADTEMKDISNALPVYHTSENFFLLPIYANDKATDFVEENLTLWRTIKYGSTLYFDESKLADKVANKVLVFNASADLVQKVEAYESDNTNNADLFAIYANGEVITIKAADVYVVADDSAALLKGELTAKTYKAYYNAKDAVGNEKTSPAYSMTISGSTVSYEAPEISMPADIPSVILPGDEVTFTVKSPSDAFDSRIGSLVSYTTNESATSMTADSEDSLLTLEDGTYTLAIPEDATITSLTLKIFAINEDGQTAEVSKDIHILVPGASDTTEVVNAPVNNDLNYGANFTQNTSIYLPNVEYRAQNADYLNVEILVESENGTMMDVMNANARRVVGDIYKVNNAYFEALEYGDYEVTYISTDLAGNKTIVSYTITVAQDTSDLTVGFKLNSQINGGEEANRGDEIVLGVPTFTTNADDSVLEYVGYEIEIDKAATLVGKTKFIPMDKGVYHITYKGYATVLQDATINGVDYFAGDEVEFASQTYTLTVNNQAPTLENEDKIKEFFENLNAAGKTLTLGDKVTLPTPITNDDDIVWEDSKVVISHATGSDEEIEFGTGADRFTALTDVDVFGDNAVYTITYTLVDKYGDSKDYAFTLNVGDVTAPEITVEDDILKNSYKLKDLKDTNLIIDMSKIQATDKITNDGENLITKGSDNKYALYGDCKINVYLQNTSTSSKITNALTSSNTDLKYEFKVEAAGEYKLVIEITDEQGQKATYDKTVFSVTEEENAGATAEEVLGIVLIVVSVLLLGGVIAYFVVSKKSFERKYK